MQLRKKEIGEVSLDDTLDSIEDDGPMRDFGYQDQVLAGSLDRISLERAIKSLPPGYRMFFVLHDIEGYEHNEIAEMLGCSMGNSKSQLHKARLSLRNYLMMTRNEQKSRHSKPLIEKKRILTGETAPTAEASIVSSCSSSIIDMQESSAF